eukprot:Rhum_TRINITY_DN12742_c0_g1::Rhum_TRINITY_DN12742_c0_g1_i4::g.54019::m.54019/K01053/E3.1.1.17, gnl, RGN; gluconolactonase
MQLCACVCVSLWFAHLVVTRTSKPAHSVRSMADDGGLTAVLEGQPGLCGVCVGADGAVYVGNRETGDVQRVQGTQAEAVCRVGSVRALCFHDGMLLGADSGQQRVFRVADNVASDVVTDVRGGEDLIGPSGICVSPTDPAFFFSDGGDVGQTPLTHAGGAVYALNLETQALSTVAATGLAQPGGLCTSCDGRVLYVCETAQNRILRYAQHPKGVWHGSVFVQFSGLFGPVHVTVDGQGNLYVARFDFNDIASSSLVTIVRPNGEEYASFSVPGAEVSGICADASTDMLYITEASSGVLFKKKIPDLTQA